MLQTFSEECYDKSYCELKVQYSWFNIECRRRLFFYASKSKFGKYAKSADRDWHWYIRNDFVREPVIWGVAFCVSD